MILRIFYISIIILTSIFGIFTQAVDPLSAPLGDSYNNSEYEELIIQPVPVEMEIIYSIPVGSGDSEVGYSFEDIQGGMTSSPRDLLITENYIYLCDELNKRQFAISRDLKDFKMLGDLFHTDSFNYLDGNDEYLITSGKVYNLTEDKLLIDRNHFAYDNIHPEYELNPYYFNFIEDRFLILDNRGNKGIVLLDLLLDNNSFDNVMYDHEAEEYLKKNSSSIEIKDGRYVLQNQILVTKSTLAFLRYFREHNNQINYNSYEMGDYLDSICGIDADDNYYISAYGNQIYIFDKAGNFVQAVQIKNDFSLDFVTYGFSVDSEGNLYSLAIDEEKDNYVLVRVKRNW